MKKNIQRAGLLIVALLFLCGGVVAGVATVWAASGGEGSVEAVTHDTSGNAQHGEEGNKEHGSILSAAKVKDFVWRITNFIALMVILVHFGAKPLGENLSSRKKQIADEIAELEQRKEEAEKSYNEFQQKIASVEAEIDTIVERAVAQAKTEKEKILQRAEAVAEEMKRSAEQAVANEVAEARTMLREEIADKAAAMAEEIIGKNLQADDQKTIIENYLAKVGAAS